MPRLDPEGRQVRSAGLWGWLLSIQALRTPQKKARVLILKSSTCHSLIYLDIVLRLDSIICVPAIGADARATWVESNEDGLGWLGALQDKLPTANLLLYDHLEAQERSVKVADPKDAAYKSTAKAFADAEAALSHYSVDHYADRFLRVAKSHRLEVCV